MKTKGLRATLEGFLEEGPGVKNLTKENMGCQKKQE